MFKYIVEFFSRKSNNTNELGVVYPRLQPTYTPTFQITAVTMNELYTPSFTPPTNYFNYSGVTHIGVTHSGVSYYGTTQNYGDIFRTTQKKMIESKEDIFLKKLEEIKKKK